MCRASCQPTIIRENTSITQLKNARPSQQRRYVKSVTHSRSGAAAVKSRMTRSAGRCAPGSAVVVFHGLPRRLAPWMPFAAISRATWSRPAASPSRTS